jgi:hypothetical protein
MINPVGLISYAYSAVAAVAAATRMQCTPQGQTVWISAAAAAGAANQDIAACMLNSNDLTTSFCNHTCQNIIHQCNGSFFLTTLQV